MSVILLMVTVKLSSPQNHYMAATYHTPHVTSTASEDLLHVEVYNTKCRCVASHNLYQKTTALHSYRH